MTDVTITAADVRWLSGTPHGKGTGGAAIDEGEVLYKDAADGELKLALADDDDTSSDVVVALSNGEDGRQMLFAPPGARLDWGATLAAGTVYVLSAANAGGLAPLADITNEEFVVIMCIGEGTTNANFIGAKGPVAVPPA